MEVLNFLMTEGIDIYLFKVVHANPITIAGIIMLLGILVKRTKTTADDEALGVFQKFFSMLKKKNGNGEQTPQ